MLKLEDVYAALKEVIDLRNVRNVLLQKKEDGVKIKFQLSAPADQMEELKKKAEDALKKLPGVKEIEIEEKPTTPISVNMRRHPDIKHIIAVTSGKGGVGKSTVAVNLAVALAAKNYKVGLLDGDIYGPSVPKMLGLEKSQLYAKDGKIIPIERFGIKVLSIGFLIEEDTPVIWRGPLVHKTYEQFYFDVHWGELDFLIVDFPPGTGDPQISASQLMKLRGGIAVTTPQDVAISDVKKAINMFLKMNIPVIGVVENMSYFRCPKCGHVTRIFGEGGGKKLEEEMGVKLLAQLPIEPEIVKAGDIGMPVIMAMPESESAKVYLELAETVAQECERIAKETPPSLDNLRI